MLKPNIRGFPRSRLRLGIRGWRVLDEPDLVINHRLPWRKSWIFDLQRNPAASPLMSRTGATFLLVKHEPASSRNLSWFVSAVGFLMLSIVLFVGLPDANSKSIEEKNHLQHSTEPRSTCQDLLGNPALFLEGTEDSLLQIKVLEVQKLGGVQSKVIDVSCGSEVRKFRVTEVWVRDQWKIAKTAQLN